MSRAVSPSSPASLRQAAEALDRQGDFVWLQSEDLLALATSLKARARELREAAEDLELAEEAQEWLGRDIRLVKGDAA